MRSVAGAELLAPAVDAFGAGGGGIVIRIVRPEVPAPSLALRWENDETSGDGSGEVGDGTEAGEVGMDAVSDDDDVVT